MAGAFPTEGSGLARYAAVFAAVEINSTFYRPHRASTLARWAGCTPPDFRFSVKAPRTITHDARLVGADGAMARFIETLDPLRPKLGAVLVQLPPSLAFDPAVAEPFFENLRRRETSLPIACEPRHATWFEPEADALLEASRVARVAADPARDRRVGEPGGWRGLAYHRLHGSPRMYFSAYGPAAMQALAEKLACAAVADTWCVFDNTASGAAAADGLELRARLANIAADCAARRPSSAP